MKVTEKSKKNQEKVKKKGSVSKAKPKKEQVLVIAQEIKYARWLSGNDKKTRDRVLKALKKWLSNCFEKNYEFKEEDFTRVWKGLFYAVWMSDKPLIQEELCENISGILDLFPPEQLQHALLMSKAGFKMLATEWYGIDQHRIDKFLMLVRRYLRGSLRILKRCEWSLKSCQKYSKMLTGSDGLLSIQTPHYARNAGSMLLHFTDCFLEELAKVSSGDIPPSSLTTLIYPFARYTSLGSNPTLCVWSRRLLTALLRHSAHAQDYEGRTRAWKQMGCPEGGPEALEPMSDDEEDPEMNGDDDGEHSDDDLDDKPLDPRAGRVDVTLAPLPVPAQEIADMLRELLKGASSKAHRRLKICVYNRYETLAQGQYPLPVETPPPLETVKSRPRAAARELRSFEHKLKLDADELKLRGLSRKHRKRLLRKSRAGLSIVEEVETIHKALSTKSDNGDWVVEPTETNKQDTSNKENQDKNKKDKKVNGHKRAAVEKQDNVNNKKRKLDKDKNSIVQNTVNKKEKVKQDKSKVKVVEPVKLKQDKNKVTAKEDKKPQHQVPEKNKVKLNDKNKKDIAKTDKVKEGKKDTSKKTDGIKWEAKKNKKVEKPMFVANKVKKFNKQTDKETKKALYETPKKVVFQLKNNSMQKPVDYYKSVRQSPNIPFDSSKKPTKTNLKPSTPSPINPFFKKKLRMRN